MTPRLMLTQLGDNQPQARGRVLAGQRGTPQLRRRTTRGGQRDDAGDALLLAADAHRPGAADQRAERAHTSTSCCTASGSQTDTWYGEIQKWTPHRPRAIPLSEYDHEENDYTNGLTVPSAGAPGAIVQVGACFGAYTLDSPFGNTHKTRDNSLAMKFLAAGSRAFIADTYISESTNAIRARHSRRAPAARSSSGRPCKDGATPIDAFFSRQVRSTAQMIQQQYAAGDPNQSLSGDTNFLALHEMVYLGRP